MQYCVDGHEDSQQDSSEGEDRMSHMQVGRQWIVRTTKKQYAYFRRARKVKCDERFPACNRCVSTGRVCDGYGIWGGGGNSYGERYAKSTSPSEQCSATFPGPLVHRISARPGLATASERAYMDWFQGQTATRLPGVFGSGFWDYLVLQASATEPAVLHAVLALSCAHRSTSIAGIQKAPLDSNGPDKHEQFCLRQYSSAICGLKPHFMSSTRESLRVALIACLIFTCLEFVRGHYQTAKTHLQNGLQLLNQLKVISRGANGTECPSLSRNDQSVDGWLAEQFARLMLQSTLFGQGASMHKVARIERGPVQPVSFVSTSHARKCLDQLISEASSLAESYSIERAGSLQRLPSPEILEEQSRIQYALAAWFTAYEASSSPSGITRDIASVMGFKILHSYYLVARIMLSTCLRLDGEMAYDYHTQDFRAILLNSWQLGEIVFNDAPGTKFAHDPSIPPIVADMGWITPLYFTAIKCRVKAVRSEAIRFLSHGDCKEGIWDAALASQVGTQIMKIEEEGDGDSPNIAAPDVTLAESEEHKLPSETDRVFDVEVILPEGSITGLGVVCKRRNDDGSCETISRRRDPHSGLWTDIKVADTKVFDTKV